MTNKTWNEAKTGESLFYDGKRTATIASIEPEGINLRVSFDSGFAIVVPPSGECLAR